MRVVTVVQARMGSSRLPGKSLRVLAGRPLIAHVVERALALRSHGVVVATSDAARDDLLALAVAPLGVQVVRGPEHDVLERVRIAAELTAADVVIRVTGDCPLWAPDVGMRVLAEFLRTAVDYAWNDTARSGYPDGTDVEVMRRAALDRAAALAEDRQDREHVTPFIRRTRSVAVTYSSEDHSSLKLSVDRLEDFERVQRIYALLPPGQLLLADTLEAARAAGEL